MQKAKTKRISALVSLLLVVTVLFGGNVFASEAKLVKASGSGLIKVDKVDEAEDEGVVPLANERNSIYIRRIKASPAYTADGESGYVNQNIGKVANFGYVSYAGLPITKAEQESLKQQFSSTVGMTQNGWYVTVTFEIDSASPAYVDIDAGVVSFRESISKGIYEHTYFVKSVDSIPTWVGILTFLQNGPGTVASNASVILK